MTKAVRVTNNSIVDCAFSWSFLEDVNSDEERHGTNPRRARIPVNQVCDKPFNGIVPLGVFVWNSPRFRAAATTVLTYIVEFTTKEFSGEIWHVGGGQVDRVQTPPSFINICFQIYYVLL